MGSDRPGTGKGSFRQDVVDDGLADVGHAAGTGHGPVGRDEADMIPRHGRLRTGAHVQDGVIAAEIGDPPVRPGEREALDVRVQAAAVHQRPEAFSQDRAVGGQAPPVVDALAWGADVPFRHFQHRGRQAEDVLPEIPAQQGLVAVHVPSEQQRIPHAEFHDAAGRQMLAMAAVLLALGAGGWVCGRRLLARRRAARKALEAGEEDDAGKQGEA